MELGLCICVNVYICGYLLERDGGGGGGGGGVCICVSACVSACWGRGWGGHMCDSYFKCASEYVIYIYMCL